MDNERKVRLKNISFAVYSANIFGIVIKINQPKRKFFLYVISKEALSAVVTNSR